MLSHQLRLGTLIAVIAVAAFATPAAAQEQTETVPPDNSAATQYTEAFPTAGGNRDAYGHERRRTPREALGARKARELERRGPAGEEVAELVAETAPTGATYAAPGAASGGGAGFGTQAADGGGATDEDTASESPIGSEGSGGGTAGGIRTTDSGAADTWVAVSAAGGSSGIGSALSAALGSSGNGGLLPAALLLTALWALLYATLRRRRTAE